MISGRDKWTLFLVIISMFATAWVLTKDPVEIYSGYVVILTLLPIYMIRFGIPVRFWYFLIFFLATGMLNIALGNNSMDQFLKILLGVLMSYLFYYYVLARFEFDVEVVFRAYMIGAVVVSIIALFQFVSYMVGFKLGYDFRWTGLFNKWNISPGGNLGLRVNSIFSEPSSYAAILAPAMFVAINNLISFRNYLIKRWQSILILIMYVLTFSSLGFIGIFIALLLLMVNYGLGRFIFLFAPLLVIAFFVMYNYVEDFRYRWDSTVYLFETGQVDIGAQHGSAIVFYNNFVVATENVKSNFLFGTGLGSHPFAFEQYSITRNIEIFGFALNSADANSMLLRIISEIGLLGVLGAIIFIRRNFVRRDVADTERNEWIISSATLCIILLFMVRQGHYFLNGFPFFVWIYYYCRRWADRVSEQIEIEREEEEESDPETGDEGLIAPERI